MRHLVVLSLSLLIGCGIEPAAGSTSPAPSPSTEAPFVERIPTHAVAATRAMEVHLTPPERRRVLRDVTTPVVLLLEPSTVFCSALGYGVSFLKVSVPDLDDLARFDHRVSATGLPCAAAGACTDRLGPDAILQGRPGLERVDLRVVLTEVLTFDRPAQRCTRQLTEEVFASVRGVPLRHSAEGPRQALSWDRCQALEALAEQLSAE
jgi:hypothetical protein